MSNASVPCTDDCLLIVALLLFAGISARAALLSGAVE